MSKEVKRWEPENTIVGYNMRPCADGSFVLADAYDALLAERDALRDALKYYADGEHFCLANEDAWDTVSGEPMNILHHDDGFGESEGYVEDGSIARTALQGAQP